MSSAAKRKVIQTLHNMGFSDADIRAAILECGYNVEACSDWIVNRKQNASKPRLHIGMDVWIFSREDNDWCPGNVVSVTKQLVSIIFKGHDFRWLEKESDIFCIQDEKPAPRATGDQFPYMEDQSGDDDGMDAGPYHEDQYTAPRQDEVDYYVTFTESVLGLELYSDEDGFNCIVGRCVSTIARQKVTPGSQIVQVNDRWLANYRFEEIRDAVKQAARQPPLAVTFRIKKALLRTLNQPDKVQGNAAYPNAQDNSGNNNPSRANENTAHLFAQNNPNGGYGNGQPYNSGSGTSPIEQSGYPMNGSKSNLTKPQTQNVASGSLDEEKRSQPPNEQNEEVDFMGTLTMAECDQLQIGDHIDHRDDVGRFLLATIVDKDQYKVKIHYEGWNSKWDTWCDYQNETHRFAKPRSISRKANTRFRDLKIRDYVDINPIQRHRGWRVGQIRRMDKYSGQAQIVYKEDGQEFLYWAHLNNPEEIAPFMTRAAETIAIQTNLQQSLDDNQHPRKQDIEVNVIDGHNANDLNQKRNQKMREMEYGMQMPPSTVNTGKATQHTVHRNNHGAQSSMDSVGQQAQPPPAQQQHDYNEQNYGQPRGVHHGKSKSKAVPLPLTLIKRPLPPKPPKGAKKKKNGVSRSRTQPLPDNKGPRGIVNINPNNNSNLHEISFVGHNNYQNPNQYNYEYTSQVNQVNNVNNPNRNLPQQLNQNGQPVTMDLSYLDGGGSKPLPPKPSRKNNGYNDPSLL